MRLSHAALPDLLNSCFFFCKCYVLALIKLLHFYIVDGNINPSYYLITQTFPSDLSYFAMFEMRLRVETLYPGYT